MAEKLKESSMTDLKQHMAALGVTEYEIKHTVAHDPLLGRLVRVDAVWEGGIESVAYRG